MSGRNLATVAVILLLVAVVVFFLMFEVDRISEDSKLKAQEAHTQELADNLNTLDYEIYWIGQVPEYLDAISSDITVLTVGQAGFETLPVAEGNTAYTVYDKDGNEVGGAEKRDYAQNMMIVINTDDEISDALWDVIRNCAVQNYVPVLLIGGDNIDAFREYMILVKKTYGECDSMLFEYTRDTVENPIDPEAVSGGGRAYADALLEFFFDRFGEPIVVYVTSTPTPEAVESTLAEETSGAA